MKMKKSARVFHGLDLKGPERALVERLDGMDRVIRQRTFLFIYENGVPIRYYMNPSENEDVPFFRDLYWLEKEINSL